MTTDVIRRSCLAVVVTGTLACGGNRTAPAPGTYSLGGREGFSGSVEIYSTPQRDFLISGGELTISEARGDVLTGRFTLTAREQTEEYTATPPEIRVEGTFLTRPAS